MRRLTEKPYLLAPAGSPDAFYAALASGADAIYLGVQDFNARAYAKNFDYDALRTCLGEAHARGVKVYVTLNTLLYDKEMDAAIKTAIDLWEMGVDALICADVGLIFILRVLVPDIAIHASTQLSLHSGSGAREVADLGCEQVVLARELTRENISTCVEEIEGATIEVFAHGALCVCHSGQCLFSSLVGGRSGNRGECAQPCRLPYNGGYPLSLKDLTLAEHIPSLIESGVACLKIEGRMKSPAYVGGVVRIFRRLLDEGRAATKEEMRELAAIFSRDGFTDGYYTGNLTKGMTGVRREADKQETRTFEQRSFELEKIPLNCHCKITFYGSSLTLTDPCGRSVTVEGEGGQVAKNQPLTREQVRARLAKLGNTPYTMGECSVEVEEGLFMTPAVLNDLRRRGVEALLNSSRQVTHIDRRDIDGTPPLRQFLSIPRTALFMNSHMWEALGEEANYFDISFIPLWEIGEVEKTPSGVWLHPVIMDDEEQGVVSLLRLAKASGVEWALCGNPASVRLAREVGLRVMGDFRLNVTNSYALSYWYGHGVEDCVLSPELTAPQLRDLCGRTLVYGRIPLMLTERCYATTCDPKTCGKPCEHDFSLKDRMGKEFPCVRVPAHRNMILNSLPTYLCDQRKKLPSELLEHYIFSIETLEEIKDIIKRSQGGIPLDTPVRRLPK